MDPHATPLEITAAEASALRAADPSSIVILDVREPHELAINQIAGATHIPLREIPAQMPTLPRDRYLLVLCHHGYRSLRVTQFLRDQGFTTVSNIAGGIDAWAAEVDLTMRRY